MIALFASFISIACESASSIPLTFSWMKRYDWCSFSWDPEAFPDPKKYLADIKKEYNVKVCAWVNPYIAQRADIFKEGVEKGYFVKRMNGSVWQW